MDPIYLTSLAVESFQRLHFARVSLDEEGELIVVSGPSGSGKSSLLRAVKAAFGGAAEVVEGSVNDASPDGTAAIQVELSNGYTVRRRFTANQPKGYLTIEGPDGGKHGQTKLTEWIGPLAFDPMAFLHLSAADQRDLLFRIASVEGLQEKLDAAKEREGEAYSERTPWISKSRRVGKVPEPDFEEPEAIDTAEAMERLDELEAERERQENERRHLRSRKEHRFEVDERIADLYREIEELEEHSKTLTAEIDDLEAKLDEAEPVDGRIHDVREKLRTARSVDEAIEAWDRYHADQKAKAEADEMVAKLTEEVEAARQEQRDLLAEAEIPVEGLDFTDEGEITLHGKPLELAAGGERVTMALDVALAVESDLRVCLLDAANELDLDQVRALAERAEAAGVQVFAARMGLEGPGNVVVDDGIAVNRDEERDDAEDDE